MSKKYDLCHFQTKVKSFDERNILNPTNKKEEGNTCVTGFNILIFSGNCAFVTRKVEICLPCSSSTRAFISGYMIGSPTRDKAQCLGERPSDKRSCVTPVTMSQQIKRLLHMYIYVGNICFTSKRRTSNKRNHTGN